MLQRLPVILILLFFSTVAHAQVNGLADTVKAPSDSVTADTLVASRDSGAVSGVDTVITYTCSDSIVFSISTKIMSMYRKGDIKYQKMGLQAERIDIDWDTSTLTAFGAEDSADTSGKHRRGLPVMKDGGEVYKGEELKYNFRSKRGSIRVADTEMDQGFYHGEQLKKMSQDVLFVADGRYTTCDSSSPHYYFFSPKMKVTLQDKVIAEPIYMYIADVPVFWFPVAVFPSKGGRRSGIIPPAIAEDATHGRILRHMGYYWAISDYMDWSMRTDLYTKGSWALFSDYRYSLRYKFSGSLSGQYRKMIEGESSDAGRKKNVSYNVRASHRQEINPTMRFDVDFTFASNNSFQNTIDLNQALRQEIYSNATISKSWEGTPNSMSVNVSRRQNLINGNVSEVLPSISFNHSQSYPFRFGKKSYEDLSALAWHEMIGVSYSANLSNGRSKIKESVKGVRVSIDGIDTTTTVDEFAASQNQRLTQGLSFNIAPKIGYVTVAPSLSYRDERSVNYRDDPDTSGGDVVFRHSRAWYRYGAVTAGISASTKLYGMLQPNMLGVQAFRHTLTPTLSLSYSQQVVGESPAPKQMVMNFGVGNNFEMKLQPVSEGEEPKKIQLLNLSAGLSYNFSADSLNFSPIGISYRTNIANAFDIAGGAGFDLYKLEQRSPNNYQRVNKFLLTEEGRLARMTNFSVSLSSMLSGESSSEKDTTESDEEENVSTMWYGKEEELDFSIPWRLQLSWDYSENKAPPKSRSSSMRGSAEISLTKNWKVSLSGGYDIMNREILVPQIVISRDLHCWVMNFSWVPIGQWRHYQFQIRLKAPQLQDIKITKQGSSRGIY